MSFRFLRPLYLTSLWILVAFSLLMGSRALAQQSAAAPPATVPAVFLSDLHFDPFHDPARIPLLVSAPVDQWNAILSRPDSATQPADFAAIQDACKSKESIDSPFLLFSSALQTARQQAPNARFVLVSGDLLVHKLDCRYRAALHLPKAQGDNQSVSAAFAEKTTVFVMKQVEQVFSGIPVYLALGNNDSRCNHNRLDLHDEILQATGPAVIDGLVGASAEERKLALATYQSAGYYAVTMAAPMKRTRLLVLNDTYMMSSYSNCEADSTDHKGADEQLSWLNKELDDAQKRGEHVWVLSHVPPSVDPPSSDAAQKALCAGGKPQTLLASDGVANALASHAGTVRLAVFGHTHDDELRLLGSQTGGVPVKILSSVTPSTTNTSTFTVARVAPSSAVLMDYSVYTASNNSGVETLWSREYSFDDAYHEPSFTSSALEDLIGRFRGDPQGSGADSQAYQRYFEKGAAPAASNPRWRSYVCSLDHASANEFRDCVCGAN